MHRTWSIRHAEASPASAPLTPTTKPQLRRMASFTHRFRPGSSKLVVLASPLVEEDVVEEVEEARPRTVYVPTHAAASFARTASPLSPSETGGDHDQDHECEYGCLEGSRSCVRRGSNTKHSLTLTLTRSRSNHTSHLFSPDYTYLAATDAPRRSSTSPSSPPSSAAAAAAALEIRELPPSDYAAFVAEAEAREAKEAKERAVLARMALQIRDSPAELLLSTANPAVSRGAHRDSAYYSNGSRSTASGGDALNRGACSVAARDTVPPLPPTLSGTKRQPKTLRRRLSEYFRPL